MPIRGCRDRGTDPISLQHWFLSFMEAISKLCEIIAEFVGFLEWLANEKTP